jgi:glycolate oxidase
LSDASAVVALIPRLRAICGDAHVVTQHDELRTYASDGLLQYAVTPGVVVLPGSGTEVRDVVRACHEVSVPWVARGSGSGLSGGALPVEDGVLIGLSRLKAVVEVDLDNQRVVVEPGVTNVAVSAAVGPTHFYPPDPSSQIVCSIGGNVAENSGGAHCFKYGFTTNYVTGLEVVLADGEVVQVGGKELDRPGYDLLGALVGSEGTLAVVTRITLRVVPAPDHVETMVAFFESTSDAGEVVSEIVSAGITPAAIEMMDGLAISASEQMAHAGYPLDAGACLLIELDGPHEECRARLDEVIALCERHGGRDLRVAQDEPERQLLWKTRKAAFPAAARISPHYFVQDGVIPRTQLPEVLRRIDALAAEYDMRVANVFHAGDGNLHPLVCYSGPEDAARAEELAGRILAACVELGGSLTGEHGIGVDKKAHMPKMFDESDLQAFQKLRCAFDPGGLANPGKIMPTPRLCGEVPGPFREHPLERAGLAERF